MATIRQTVAQAALDAVRPEPHLRSVAADGPRWDSLFKGLEQAVHGFGDLVEPLEVLDYTFDLIRILLGGSQCIVVVGQPPEVRVSAGIPVADGKLVGDRLARLVDDGWPTTGSDDVTTASGFRLLPIRARSGKALGGVAVREVASQGAPIDSAGLRLLEALLALASQTLELGRLRSREHQVSDKNLQILALSKVGNWMTRIFDLEQLLNGALRMISRLLDVEMGGLLVADERSSQLVLKAHVGFPDEVVAQGAFPLEGTADGWVYRSGEPVLVADLETDTRFSQKSWASLGARSLLVVPLRVRDRTVGVLSVMRRPGSSPFDREDQLLLVAMANQISVALESAGLYQEALRKQEMARELAIAREIQMSLLPREFPVVPGLGMAAESMPAREVGGDFYDVFTSNRGHLFVVIGDVSGKGVPAALFMAMARSLFRTVGADAAGPGRVLEQANRLLCPDLKRKKMLITAQCVMYSPRDRKLTMANAGHVWPLHSAGRGFREVELAGMPLGAMTDSPYAEEELTVGPGHRLILYSDGVVECVDSHGELFGFDRLRELVDRLEPGPPPRQLEALLAEVIRFKGDGPLPDDTTAVTICWS
ncbi:MAG: SpoIIE family protein phosphatase [Candidatus Riflebacteria bacterium]|nr:SpoIIE family protein phosphatase [Candidatus Riflebacteria bacterium]